MSPTQQVLAKIEELGNGAAEYFGVTKSTIGLWKKNGSPSIRAYERLLAEEPDNGADNAVDPVQSQPAEQPRIKASDVLEVLRKLEGRIALLEGGNTNAVATQSITTPKVPGPVAVPIHSSLVKQPKIPARSPNGQKGWAKPFNTPRR